jgi:alpha-galactosidase
VLPEQAGNWAYPQSGMSREEFTLCLVNGVLGRMYLSGHLNRMTQPELELVRSALAAHRSVLTHLPELVPFWPLGLPGWTDEWVALGLAGPSTSYLTVWHRSAEASQVELPLPHCEVRSLFPAQADGWTYDWQDNTLTITANTAEPSARVVELIGRT